MPQIIRGFAIEEVLTRPGRAPESSVSLEFLDEDIEVLNAITQRYQVSAHLFALGWTPRTFGRPDPPWAILALPAHYAILGHLMAARERKSDYLCSYYAQHDKPYDPTQSGVPPAGLIHIFSAEGFTAAAARSPCVAALSRNLEEVSRRGHWLVIADPLPDESLAEWAIDNDVLFWGAYPA